MKKLFITLLVLSSLGALILIWLVFMMPPEKISTLNDKPVKEGLKVVDSDHSVLNMPREQDAESEKPIEELNSVLSEENSSKETTENSIESSNTTAPKETVKTEKIEPKMAEAKLFYKKGKQKGFFLQIKSLPRDPRGTESIEKEILDLRKTLQVENIMGCHVNLGAKGLWVRILIGPFVDREAAIKFRTTHSQIESIISKDQDCEL